VTSLHRIHRINARACLVACIAMSLLTGCIEPVAVGGEGGQGGGSSGSGPATVDGTAIGTGHAGPASTVGASTGPAEDFQPRATLRRNSDAVEEAFCINSSTCDIPDDAVILVVDTARPVCDLPLDRPYPQHAAGWRIVIGIPAQKLVVGRYVLAEHPDIRFELQGYEESNPSTTSGQVGGGPQSPDAEIEIVAVDGLVATIRTTGLAYSFDSDGEWVTTPCE
jgi:hypothetical protein